MWYHPCSPLPDHTCWVNVFTVTTFRSRVEAVTVKPWPWSYHRWPLLSQPGVRARCQHIWKYNCASTLQKSRYPWICVVRRLCVCISKRTSPCPLTNMSHPKGLWFGKVVSGSKHLSFLYSKSQRENILLNTKRNHQSEWVSLFWRVRCGPASSSVLSFDIVQLDLCVCVRNS